MLIVQSEPPYVGCYLVGTRAEIGRASGYRALYSGLEDQRVSLNTYARRKWSRGRQSALPQSWLPDYLRRLTSAASKRNGIPCESCTHLNGFADRRLGCSANGTESTGGGLRFRPRWFPLCSSLDPDSHRGGPSASCGQSPRSLPAQSCRSRLRPTCRGHSGRRE